MEPLRLYKYLPSKYIENVVEKGEILFRNLTYFRQYECEQRGDLLEALHRDNPDNDVEIYQPSTGAYAKGDFSYLNSTDSDLIFVFCLSISHTNNLYTEFNSDACIEITDPGEFIRRIRIKVKQLISSHKKGLIYKPVHYYAANKAAEFNIKDPFELPFAKDKTFNNQDEYRLIFGTRKAFKLIQRVVVNSSFNFKKDAMKGTPKDKMVRIGNISDITIIRRNNT